MQTKFKTSTEENILKAVLKNKNFRNNQNYLVTPFGRKKIFDSYFERLITEKRKNNKILKKDGRMLLSEEFIKDKIKVNESIILNSVLKCETNNKRTSYFVLGFFILGSLLMLNEGINIYIILVYFSFGLIISYLIKNIQYYPDKIYNDYIIGKLNNTDYFINRYK